MHDGQRTTDSMEAARWACVCGFADSTPLPMTRATASTTSGERNPHPEGPMTPDRSGTCGILRLVPASLRACSSIFCSSAWVAGPVSGSTVMRPEGSMR